jgi:formate hydrogenlyase subunit 3/multisubunit Na+/H+ antiporter MnhD subunit
VSGWLPLALGLPLALAAALAWRRTRAAALAVAPWAAAPALAGAIAAPDARVVLPWLGLGSVFVLDDATRVFFGLAAALWLAAGVYGAAYLARDDHRASYAAFFLAAMAGNLGLCVAEDLASFYVFFALMSFASYGLVVHARNEAACRAGRIYLALVVVGELALFSGFVLVAAQPGAGGLAALGPQRAPGAGWAAALLFVGFGIKAGALPLHVWLPLAHPVAPTPASAVLSGAMIKAGLVGWLRFLPLGEPTAAGWAAACVALGLAGALYGALCGIGQRDAKTVLAYSSISQMGLVTVAFGVALAAPAAGTAAAVACAVHHGLAKAVLFLGVGIAAAAGARASRTLVLAGLVAAGLALAGLPATSGAAAKLALKAALDALPAPWPAIAGALLPVAALGTTLLMARFVFLVWPRAPGKGGGASMWAAWLALLAGVLTAPVWLPGWSEGVAGTLAPATLAQALWPIAGGVALALAALGPLRQAGRLPRAPAGDLVVVFEAAWRALDAGAREAGARVAALRDALRARIARLAPRRVPLERAESGLAAGPVAAAFLATLAALLVLVLQRT